VSGKVDVSAKHFGASETRTDGKGAGGTAVGASIALSFVDDSATASTARDITAGGAVSFTASGEGASRAHAIASAAGTSSDSEKSKGNSKADDQQKSTTDLANAKAGTNKSSGQSAQTEGGDVSVAAALAINVANSDAIATTGDGLTITAGKTGAGTLTVGAANHMEAAAIADGRATTKSGGTSVGAAIAINVAHMTNEGSVGAGSVVDADGVTVEATMIDQEVAFEPTSIPVVDVANDTIFLGADHGLKNGDKVTYDNGEGSSIGGLTDDGLTKYSVIVEDGGKIKLAAVDSEGNVGAVVNLTSAGSGTATSSSTS
jgi:hypothetical protein